MGHGAGGIVGICPGLTHPPVGKKFEERPSSPDPAEQAGYHISFVEYMKACWWPMMITVTICMIYLLIAY
jgi:hypothetical protein